MSDTLAWGPANEERRIMQRRPFDFRAFVLSPMYDNESVCYNRNECDKILPNTTGIAQTNYEDSESDLSILHRTAEGELLAVCYVAIGQPLPVHFDFQRDADEFLKHLKACTALQRAAEQFFLKKQHATEISENLGDETYQDDLDFVGHNRMY